MLYLIKVLIILAALCFVIAVITALAGPIAGIQPEGFSRACTNLALISVALAVLFKEENKGSNK